MFVLHIECFFFFYLAYIVQYTLYQCNILAHDFRAIINDIIHRNVKNDLVVADNITIQKHCILTQLNLALFLAEIFSSILKHFKVNDYKPKFVNHNLIKNWYCKWKKS